jgi:hypothetical protein
VLVADAKLELELVLLPDVGKLVFEELVLLEVEELVLLVVEELVLLEVEELELLEVEELELLEVEELVELLVVVLVVVVTVVSSGKAAEVTMFPVRQRSQVIALSRIHCSIILVAFNGGFKNYTLV